MTDDEVMPPPEFMRVYFGSNGGYFRAAPIVGEIYALQVKSVSAEYATLELIKIKDAP